MIQRQSFPRALGRVLWILGMVTLGLAVFTGRKQIVILSTWAKADGRVTASEIVRYFSVRHKPVYRLRLTMQYKVDGIEHFAVSSSALGSSDLTPVTRKAGRYPVGSHHTIYYDPLTSTEMCFDAGYNVEFVAAPLIVACAGLVFVTAGGILRVRARRSS